VIFDFLTSADLTQHLQSRAFPTKDIIPFFKAE
jgi:hypothetical protein